MKGNGNNLGQGPNNQAMVEPRQYFKSLAVSILLTGTHQSLFQLHLHLVIHLFATFQFKVSIQVHDALTPCRRRLHNSQEFAKTSCCSICDIVDGRMHALPNYFIVLMVPDRTCHTERVCCTRLTCSITVGDRKPESPDATDFNGSAPVLISKTCSYII